MHFFSNCFCKQTTALDSLANGTLGFANRPTTIRSQFCQLICFSIRPDCNCNPLRDFQDHCYRYCDSNMCSLVRTMLYMTMWELCDTQNQMPSISIMRHA